MHNEADLIFLAYSKYADEYYGKDLRQLTGFALLPKPYAQTGGEYEALREAAFWTEQLKRSVNLFLPSLPEQLSDKLVAQWHEQLITNPAAKPKTEASPSVTQPPAVVKPASRALNIQPGQKIYVTASRLNGPVDPTAEGGLEKAFEQQKFFKLTRKLSEADFIFLVYCAYEAYEAHEGAYLDSLTGFALTPEQYSRLKGNLDALREEALWQDRMRRSWTGADSERLGGRLAQKFHDDLRAARTATEPLTQQPPPTSAGVGEVKNGSGVYGLRRALALTGAETQMMSLWPVSDRGTSDLMIEYYKALQSGQGRSEAMRQVQLRMLKGEKRQHPYFWASFIVSGEWANLDGKR